MLKKKPLKKLDPKMEELLIEEMEKSKIKKKFEKITHILGVNTRQYVAI